MYRVQGLQAKSAHQLVERELNARAGIDGTARSKINQRLDKRHAQDAEAAKKDEQQAVAKQKVAKADAEPAVKKKAETEAAAKKQAQAEAKQIAEAEAAAKEAEAEALAKKKAEVEAAATQHAETELAAKKKTETVDVHRATPVTSKSAISAARTPDRGDLCESPDIGSDHEGRGCAPVDSAKGSRCPKCNVFVSPQNIGKHVQSCTQCPSCEKFFSKKIANTHAKTCPGVHRGEPVCESATAVSQPQAEAHGVAQADGAPMLLACTPSWQGRTPAQDSPMPLINGSESLVSRTGFQQPCITQARLLQHMQVGPLLLLRLSLRVCLLLFVVRFR